MKKRNIFEEMMSGVAEMRAHRKGQLTLRTHEVAVKPLPALSPRVIRQTRQALRMSRGVFARLLRANARTLERWEQGRSTPNDQAVALLLLVRRYPDTLERLERLDANVAGRPR